MSVTIKSSNLVKDVNRMDNIVMVDPHSLVAHPDRDLAGSTLSDNEGKYMLIKESIETDGISDPLKVQQGTNIIIGGHTRHRIALELGLAEVPVRFYDVDDETARFLMVTDNFKRTGDEKDAMKLAWTFRVVVASIGMTHGGNRRATEALEETVPTTTRKTMEEIAALFDMKPSNFKRYLALLKLITPLQELVSLEKIGVKTGSILSRLTHENQRKVYESIPADQLKKADYRLTENDAKSFVEAYQPSKTSESDKNDRPDGEPSGIDEFRVEELHFAELDDDVDGELFTPVEQRHVTNEEKANIALAADTYLKAPPRHTLLVQAQGVDYGYGKDGEIATKKMEGSAKQMARQLVLMDDDHQRHEFALHQLETAIRKQYGWIDRIDSELVPLRIMVGDEMTADLQATWDDLCMTVERVAKKLASATAIETHRVAGGE
jgi:hypothetical protein